MLSLNNIINLSKTQKPSNCNTDQIVQSYMERIGNSKGLLYIGANTGQEMPVLKKYAEKIYAFEPVNYPSVWNQLLTHAAEGVSFYNYALSDTTGETLFYPSSNNWESSSLFKPKFHLSEFGFVQFGDPVVIQSMRLDDFAFAKDCDTIFMDVQGGELKVLNGMSDYSNLKLIILEFVSKDLYENNCVFDELYNKLSKENFVFQEVYDCWHNGDHFAGNAVFLKE